MDTPPPSLHLPPISPAAATSLYEQIVEGIKRDIGTGRLPAHTPLPSFRALAEQLLVSLITVKRAYEELEREGIIYRKQGLGTFVAEDGIAQSRAAKQAQTERLLRQALDEGIEAGLRPEALLEIARKILKEKENEG
jgi:GntR family transcriptional regulator